MDAKVPLAGVISLKGRRAVITGGARGLGAAIAHRLAEAGAAVAIGDLDAEGARSCAAALAKQHAVACFAAHLDVRDPVSVRGFAEAAEKALGGLDIWVNNAGIFGACAFLELSVEEFDATIATNLRGAFLGAQEAARRMIARPEPGRVIVNIASLAGLRGVPGFAAYCASKHGLDGLTKALAVELGPHGVRVLTVAPSQTPTPGTRAAAAKRPPSSGAPTGYTPQRPIDRASDPDDIARVVLFAVSDLSSFMSGTALAVDGGALSRI